MVVQVTAGLWSVAHAALGIGPGECVGFLPATPGRGADALDLESGRP